MEEWGEEEAEKNNNVARDLGLIHFAVNIIVIVRRQTRWISARAREASRKSAIFSVPI